MIKKFKKMSKKPLNPLVLGVDYRYIVWFLGSVLILLISACFLASISYGDDNVDLTSGFDTAAPTPKKDRTTDDLVNNTALGRIIDMNGVVGIDGSLRVLETNYVKIFDLVEVSTPVTPVVNHARIFLTPGAGTKQQLSILWDDGTASRLAGN